ncbi:hypothetical protein [Synechococcus sp. WH 8016]|uniref:hypothetical protein n=1 Tax=Synechococcus sp. WH 8016 TaxID=166318 RepID=UPI0020A668A8|nr:hypothetical protein [Synechococcus sp. WH 8016]
MLHSPSKGPAFLRDHHKANQQQLEKNGAAVEIGEPAQEFVGNGPGADRDEVRHGKSHRFDLIWVSSSEAAFSGDNPSKIN